MKTIAEKKGIFTGSHLNDNYNGSKRNSKGIGLFTSKDSEVFNEKERLRRIFILKRLELEQERVVRYSQVITELLTRLRIFKEAKRIALYHPIKNEVETRGIFKKARSQGKEIYFPLVRDSGLEFHKVNSLCELRPGKFGILEPSTNSSKLPIERLDVLVVPGVVFDYQGRRIGYGGGYYDRILGRILKERRIGLAYGFQVLDSIPEGISDHRVGMVITESGIICAQGGG
ncbi:MAG: 5-formyltetrahydrofolate cyclo-ligase [Deltaproteobacteria bacterium]|nr:MAG: 5-formyltetrahydrofolate cyclo-ligase [Deltaproteobacteria bacterium]